MPIITEMSLGQLFRRVFTLIGETFTRVALVGFVLIVPMIALFLIAMTFSFDSMSSLFASSPTVTGSQAGFVADLPILVVGIVVIGALITALYVAYSVAVTVLMCSQMEKQAFTWKDALRMGFSVRSLRVFVANVLVSVSLTTGFVAVAVAGAATEQPVLFVLYIPLLIMVIWLMIRWMFITPVISWEHAGVVLGFRRSTSLVSGQWVRVFLLALLFGFVMYGILSLVGMPVYLIGISGFFSAYVGIMGGAHPSATPDSAQLYALVSSLGSGVIAALAVINFLSTFLQSAYSVVIYYDARARKGEFAEREDASTDGSAAAADASVVAGA